jgi:hypothetical protein
MSLTSVSDQAPAGVMSPEETLAAAAELILMRHGPDCPDRALWRSTAEQLVRARSDLKAGRDCHRELRVARTYLQINTSPGPAEDLVGDPQDGERDHDAQTKPGAGL